MSTRPPDRPRWTDATAAHADEVTAMASGRTLLLWGRDVEAPLLSPMVTDIVHYAGPGTVHGRFDSIVSLGQLGAALDLEALLAELAAHIGESGVLLFCEATIAGDRSSGAMGHDVTGAMWRGDWSVIECRRYRMGRGRRSQEYCWGRARRTRFVGPRRR